MGNLQHLQEARIDLGRVTMEGDDNRLPTLSRGSTLLERELELQQIDAAIRAAGSEQGRLTIVHGPAGIGKSALLQAAGELARAEDFRVLSARASERECTFGFAVVRQLLERAVQAEDAPGDLFDGVAAHAEKVLLGAVDPDPAFDPDYPTLLALHWVIVRLAEETPLCLLVDDLHWADPPSLRALSFLAPRLTDLPILVVGSKRPAEAGTDPGLVDALTNEVGSEVIHLSPLSRTGVEAVLSERARSFQPSAAVVDACYEATGGNPFYLGALILELEDRQANGSATTQVPEVGAGRIARFVRRRCEAMSAGTLDLARAMTILEEGEEPSLVARLAGLQADVARVALGALVRSGIVRSEDPSTFAHPIIRTSLYEDMAAAERGDWHLRAARLLKDDGASLERIAPQVVLGTPGGDPDGPQLLIEAARHASALGAPETTGRYLRRVLDEPGLDPELSVQVELELAAAEGRMGIPECAARFQRVAEHPAATRAQVCAAAEAGSTMLTFSGQEDAGLALLDGGIERINGHDTALRDRLISVQMVSVHVSPTLRLRLRDRLRQLSEAALAGNIETPAILASLAFELAAGWGPASAAADFARRGLRGLEREHVVGMMGPAICGIAGLSYAGALNEAIGWLDDALAANRASGALDAFVRISAMRAFTRSLAGDFRGAEEDGHATMGLEASPAGQIQAALAASALIEAALQRGDVAEAREIRAGFEARGFDSGTGVYQPARVAFAGIELADNDPHSALAILEESRAWDESYDERPGNRHSIWRPRAAEAYAALGEPDEAVRIADEELAISSKHGGDYQVGNALLVRGRVADNGDRMDYAEAAVDTLAGSDAAHLRAAALTDLGSLLRRKGARKEARPALREGLEIANTCGAILLAGRANQELRAAGGRPRTPLRVGVDALTASERRICQLAAGGMTNPEIAQELFLSRKTVEMHLGNAYRKLDIKRRSELAARLEAAEAAA